MERRGRRPYRPGIWVRFVAPVIGFVGIAGGTVAVVLGMLSVAMVALDEADRSTAAGWLLLGVGAFWLAIGIVGWRTSRVGVWVGSEDLRIVRLWSNRRIAAGDVERIDALGEGRQAIGHADAAEIGLRDGQVIVVRFLSSASPLRWGGSDVDEICAGLRTALAPS